MILTSIIILGSIINASIITVNQDTICQCSQLPTESSCNSLGAACTWTNSQCIAASCSNIVNNCNSLPKCYFNNGQCLEFTSCQALSGNSIETCQSQNYQCSWVSGTNCISKTSMNCGQITQEIYCQFAGNGLCFWMENMCKQLTECSQLLNEVACFGSGTACQWNYNSDTCSPSQCSSETTCSPILLSPQNLAKYQVCYAIDGYCANANVNQIAQQYCISETWNTFYWNSSSNQCVPCNSINNYGQLQSYVMGMMILLIII